MKLLGYIVLVTVAIFAAVYADGIALPHKAMAGECTTEEVSTVPICDTSALTEGAVVDRPLWLPLAVREFDGRIYRIEWRRRKVTFAWPCDGVTMFGAARIVLSDTMDRERAQTVLFHEATHPILAANPLLRGRCALLNDDAYIWMEDKAWPRMMRDPFNKPFMQFMETH